MLPNIQQLDNLDPLHNQLHQTLGQLSWGLLPEVATDSSTITIDTLPPNQAQYYQGGGENRLFYNINNSIVSTSLAGGGGGGGSSYVDRGDPQNYDFSTEDASLTADGAYHDLDLSSIIPAGAVAVMLRVSIEDNAINSQIRLRKKGATSDWGASLMATQVAGVQWDSDITLALNAGRIVEYFLSNVVWTAVYITIKAWWV